MKALKESLLGKTSDKIGSAKATVKKLMYFGGFFDVVYGTLACVTPRDVEKMSLRALKKHIVSDVGVEDVGNTLRYCQTKAVALTNYLYGLSIEDFGITWSELITKPEVKKKFGELLETRMIEQGVFKKGGYYVYVHVCLDNSGDLGISFVRNDKWSQFTLRFNERNNDIT